ncbi:MAG: NUDIX hydrolase [Xanthobacteraceae bacterium]
MSKKEPKITARRRTKISPWFEVIEREVEFAAGEAPQRYHAVGQNDYVAIVAFTPSGQIPIVRQYRPAVEAFTWELPAGLVDDGEEPAECCRRELLEETGYPARAVHALGTAYPCTGRLSNRVHSFFIETGERTKTFEPEAGLTVRLVSPPELDGLIKSGEFTSQTHLGALLLATLRSFVKF